MSKNDVDKRATPSKVQIPETTLNKTEIEDLLIRARVKMLIKKPFFGTLATRLKFIDATKWCPTAATDGKNFYYNRDFVAALNEGELIFLVGHEVLHCVYDHVRALKHDRRDPRLMNIAQDYVINLDLVEADVGEMIKLVEICFDRQYKGWTSLEVYEHLYKNAKKIEIPNSTLDVHADGMPGGDGDGEGQEGDANDGTNGPIRYSKEEMERISAETQGAVLQAAKASANVQGAGALPGGVKRLLDDILNPQIDWRELLTMRIQSIIRSNYTWQRPSRKGMDAGLYLPSMDREETIDLCIAIDTSGSITDQMMKEFLSEVYGIMSQYTDFTIQLWCFDTKVCAYKKFTADTTSDLLTYEPAGGGGTDFMANWEYMKDNDIQPKMFVMFTDMCPCGEWGDENYCDTIFISNNSRDIEAPFGITVPYKSEDAYA